MKTLKQFIVEAEMKRHHRRVLHKYMDRPSINRRLRKQKGENHPFKKDVYDMDRVTSHKSEHDFHVWRGVDHKEARHLKVGETHHHHGYLSTSKDREHASSFAFPKVKKQAGRVHITDHSRHVMKIKVHKGVKGHHVGSEHDKHTEMHEHEFIMQRGTTLHVHKHKYDPHSDTHYWHATVHKQRDDI